MTGTPSPTPRDDPDIGFERHRQSEAHHRRLEALYHHARCNAYYAPRLTVDHAQAHVEIDLEPKYHHAADAVHGSVYFKLLDDAAFFSANSLVPDVFVLTASFQLDLMRPVVEGRIRAEGHVIQATRQRILAEATLRDDGDRLLAKGSGTFMRSRILLDDLEPGPQAE